MTPKTPADALLPVIEAVRRVAMCANSAHEIVLRSDLKLGKAFIGLQLAIDDLQALVATPPGEDQAAAEGPAA